MNRSELIDRYNRHLNYLRISITDRCNLRCIYCGPSLPMEKLRHEDILSYEEIIRVVRVGVKLGIRKIRVTGGEPLVRKGVIRFLNELHRIDGIEDMSLTTNGILLKNNARRIWDAGIRRINVSLDTLQPQKYQRITGLDAFRNVWEGLMESLKLGFGPIKLNVVAMKGTNDDEFVDLARLTFQYPFHVRFIEYMPIGNASKVKDASIQIPEIRQCLASLGDLAPAAGQALDGPAERFRIEGAQGEIGFIGAMSHHFCDRCNRLRLTAAGGLRPCLLSDEYLDMKHVLRSGGSDDDLAGVFLAAVRNKPSRHGLCDGDGRRVRSQMCTIGG